MAWADPFVFPMQRNKAWLFVLLDNYIRMMISEYTKPLTCLPSGSWRDCRGVWYWDPPRQCWTTSSCRRCRLVAGWDSPQWLRWDIPRRCICSSQTGAAGWLQRRSSRSRRSIISISTSSRLGSLAVPGVDILQKAGGGRGTGLKYPKNIQNIPLFSPNFPQQNFRRKGFFLF